MKINGKYYIWMEGNIQIEISKEEHERIEKIRSPRNW